MFDYLLAVSKPFYIALYGVALPGMLIYMTPTYVKFVHNNDTRELAEKNRRKRIEDTISALISLSLALFLVYCLFNHNNLKSNVVIYILYSIIIIITLIIMLYCLILSLYAFYRMIRGEPIEEGAANNGSTIIYSTTFLLILLQFLKWEPLLLHMETLINSLTNIIVKDCLIILIYFSVCSFLALVLFVNFFNSLKMFLKYLYFKFHTKKKINPKSTIEKPKRESIIHKIDKKSDELWSIIENETNPTKICCLFAVFSILYSITLLLKAIYNIILLLFIPIKNTFKHFIIFTRTLLSGIQGSNTVAIVALSSRITIIVVFCVNYVLFKYNNIISSTGVDVFEFLFTIFIIPSIFANIVKFQHKQKDI